MVGFVLLPVSTLVADVQCRLLDENLLPHGNHQREISKTSDILRYVSLLDRISTYGFFGR